MTDRTTRYITRLDERIKGLAVADRRAFLEAEFTKWENRYIKFQRDAADDAIELITSDDGGPSAYDFIFTIGEVSKRLASLKVPS